MGFPSCHSGSTSPRKKPPPIVLGSHAGRGRRSEPLTPDSTPPAHTQLQLADSPSLYLQGSPPLSSSLPLFLSPPPPPSPAFVPASIGNRLFLGPLRETRACSDVGPSSLQRATKHIHIPEGEKGCPSGPWNQPGVSSRNRCAWPEGLSSLLVVAHWLWLL